MFSGDHRARADTYMTYKNHMDNLLEAAIKDGVVPGLAPLIDHRDGSRYEAV